MPTEADLTLLFFETQKKLMSGDLSDEERHDLTQRQLGILEQQKAAGAAEFESPRFPLAAITKGLGVPEVTIRNWLTRNQIDLGASEAHLPNKKRRFSVRDVLVIATCFQLSRHGVPVSVFALVYNDVVKLARMMLSGRPVGIMRNPVGILFNDGEWKLSRVFDSGPFHIGDADTPAVVIVINYEKITIDTLNSLGMSVRMIPASDNETGV